MLNFRGKNIAAMMCNGKMWQALYRNAELIWQAVRSCFGSGVWIDEKPWIDEELWKDNK